MPHRPRQPVEQLAEPRRWHERAYRELTRHGMTVANSIFRLT